MLPALHHRLLIVVAIILGYLPWWVIPSPLKGPGGINTATMLFAELAPATAMVLFAMMMVPALLGGLLVARLAGPLAGTFTVSATLLVAMSGSESIAAWSHTAAPPVAYLKLAIEAVIWLALAVFVITMLYKAGPRPPVRRPGDLPPASRLAHVDWQAAVGLTITSLIAAVGISLLGMSPANGQMMPAITLAFAVGSLVAGMVMARCGALPILASPLCVAMAAYVYVAVSYPTPDAFMGALYARDIPGVALALPVVYACAGTLGCTIGLSIANFAHQSVAAEHLVADGGTS